MPVRWCTWGSDFKDRTDARAYSAADVISHLEDGRGVPLEKSILGLQSHFTSYAVEVDHIPTPEEFKAENCL